MLLITGVAGAGKTHAICDAAKQRLTEGLLSIVALGEKLNEGAVFEQIREILGLPGDLSRDELLAALDAAAESSGSPLIIFVDALNERTTRDAWKNDLASLMLSGGELLWDSGSGYCDADGRLQFVAPDLTEPGPRALLAERESFLRWLDDNGLAIVWTTLSEMHWFPPGLGGGHNLGYGVHSRAHRVVDAAVKKSRGITRRIRPNGKAG